MATNPQDDADRIRLKRLAKLQGAPSSSPTPAASSSSTPVPTTLPLKPKPIISPPPQKRQAEPVVTPSPVPFKKKTAAPSHLNVEDWEHETIGQVFNITLIKSVAEKSGYEIVWLKDLAAELESEGNADNADRILISRLELDSQSMTDDLEFLPVLASLPPQQTVFEYLVGCWKRLNASRAGLLKKGYPPVEVQKATDILDKIRDLVISYTGLTLQEPEMFPQPKGTGASGARALLNVFVHALRTISLHKCIVYDIDTVRNRVFPTRSRTALRTRRRNRWVLGPVVLQLCFDPSVSKSEGFASGDAWRGVISGFEALISVKAIAVVITRLPHWNPENVNAVQFERASLLGPLLGLGVFEREWPSIAKTYYANAEARPQGEITSATASLRGTLKSLQSSLFQIFNTLVRASPESREAVLQYFSHAINLNRKRAGMQVDPDTVASDCFTMNLQTILLRFCEPFMDSSYSKMDRIDTSYYAHSSRIDLDDETRINATNDEAEEWRKQNETLNAAPPNFISDIFYLTLAINHIGQQKIATNLDELARQYDELRRHLDMLNGDGSWRGTPFQARTENAINAVKYGATLTRVHLQAEQDRLTAAQLAYEAQLGDPELVFRSISFANFVSTWLIRQVDPKGLHPNPLVELPLPKEVPASFNVLPEYLVEDVVEYQLYVIRHSPNSLELSGKTEMLVWALTFLTSTWYIKNPFLKAKIVEVIFYGTLNWGEHRSVLTTILNTHPMALKHLMPALMHFYIEVEQTGASSQFYDKFSIFSVSLFLLYGLRSCSHFRSRNIAYIFKVIWDNPAHREALKNEASSNSEKFIRFVNLMINDVTYLLDESLSELAKIHEIETEMKDRETFAAQSVQYRREREQALRSLERHASGYVQLGNSTVNLLKVFTGETKAPFMVPEIVDRLAAMLDYNLEALVGPRCQELKVSNPEKFKFDPKRLLSDIIQVFLNLSDQEEFARAVAGDGRSYRKELFEEAAKIAQRKVLKSDAEIEELHLFVLKVEEAKATLEAEEDLGEIPDEFLDPLMYTLMRDPVTLPSSRAVVDRATIKSHLLSDTKDPFNRVPLTLEDVVPNIELKQQIDSFVAERRGKKAALDKPAEDVVKMDISTD
ncbi:Ubiquitin conjugation factor E4 [Grifola frondosa]|uniref:RING-type E3 ubiquitin transferase n=1 Tax=Grifola frondosa TaxID=5627 RepID=A0A1C7M3R1_GRIFR|nr:Ubiquitin conjugation factor E4 [Grifola frondosa]